MKVENQVVARFQDFNSKFFVKNFSRQVVLDSILQSNSRISVITDKPHVFIKPIREREESNLKYPIFTVNPRI